MTKIIQRHDTSTNWTSVNPILALGEMGIETDTNKFKFGDGVTTWSELAYSSTEIDLSDYYDKETTDALLDTKQDVLTPGTNITIENNVISATGGGGEVDLSNYYTKDETYNQEEVDNLLDEKQDVLTPTAPINIGTTTIGEPNNISVVNSRIIPSSTYKAYTGYSSSTGFNITSTGPSDREQPVSLNEAFKTSSYFDIPINFSNYFTDNYSISQYVGLTFSLMSSTTSNYFDVFVGKIDAEDFKPYIGFRKQTGTSTSNSGSIVIADGDFSLYSFSSGTATYRAPALTGTTTSTMSSASTAKEMVFSVSVGTAGALSLASQYYAGTYVYTTSLSRTIGNWDINDLRNCNVIRVVLNMGNSNASYCPYNEKVTYTGGNTLDWNIASGIVRTYGISLKYDGQTIQVNSDGELVANLDELGNEVNTLAGRVTTVENKANANTEALGGKKIVTLTKAQYEALTSPDYFAWTQSSGQNIVYTTTTDNGQISKLYDSSFQEIPLNTDYPEASYIDGDTLYYTDVDEMTYTAVRNASSDVAGSSNVDNNTIYILSDSKEIYIGSIEVANYGINDDLSNLSSTGKNVIDGQWVYAGNVTLSNATGTSMYTIDLSSYLPDDGQVYEVMLNQQGAYSENSTFSGVQVKSDIIEDFVLFGYPQQYSRRVAGQVILPVGTSRSIVYQIFNHALGSNSGLKLVAYRRVGTNQ